jgi:hypothetical protein
MAIRQVVGGIPVYSIEVDVPKVTDSRGKGYGSLVSDLRWKLWEEVQASQLRQMEFEKLSQAAQLDVLKQRQKSIDDQISSLKEIQYKVKTGGLDSNSATRLQYDIAKAQQGYTSVTTRPATDPYTGDLLPGQTIETKVRKDPDRLDLGPDVLETLQMNAELEGLDAEARQKKLDEMEAARQKRIDDYINVLEGQRMATAEEMNQFIAQGPGKDVLSRTREAFQTQIGEGGFGISKRPLRQLPTFNEAEAVARLKPVTDIKNRMTELEAVFGEDVKAIPAYSNLKNKYDTAMGELQSQATSTSSRGFLMKEMPQMPTYVPSSPQRPPVPRGNIAVESVSPAIYQTALNNGPATPLSANMQRAIEMEALGMKPDFSVEKAAGVEAEQTMPATYPVERAAGLQTTTFGQPGGALDTLRYLRQKRAEADANNIQISRTKPIEMTTEAPPSTSVEITDEMGNPIVPANPFDVMKEDLMLRKKNVESIKNLEAEMPQAKASTEARSALYAMRTIKKGIELADKPKQFARVAKTQTPDNAPEYVKIVNGVYDTNSTSPNKFKLTYDEVAKVYKDDAKTREKALAYLVAKDTIDNNVTKPLA